MCEYMIMALASQTAAGRSAREYPVAGRSAPEYPVAGWSAQEYPAAAGRSAPGYLVAAGLELVVPAFWSVWACWLIPAF
jgi:hypothetical protein